MTYAEFRIRLFAYKRLEEKEWYKVREISYQVYISNWQSSKKKPLSKDKYMQIGKPSKAPSLNETQQLAIKQAQQEYANSQLKNNGR